MACRSMENTDLRWGEGWPWHRNSLVWCCGLSEFEYLFDIVFIIYTLWQQIRKTSGMVISLFICDFAAENNIHIQGIV